MCSSKSGRLLRGDDGASGTAGEWGMSDMLHLAKARLGGSAGGIPLLVGVIDDAFGEGVLTTQT